MTDGRISIGGVEATTGGITLDLDGCLEKLRRAQEHLHTLQHELWVFFDSDPYGVVGKFEREHSWYVFRCQVRRQPPLRLGVLLGDYVHQLRSTLDHWLWQLACSQTHPYPPRSTIKFPINTKRRDIERSIGYLADKIPGDWLAVIEALQPHNRHDHPLAILEKLWNTDKHQTVLPGPVLHSAAYALEVARFIGNDDAGRLVTRKYPSTVRVEDGAELTRVKLADTGANPRVDMYSLTRLEIEGDSIRAFERALWHAELTIRGLIGMFIGGDAVRTYDIPSQGYLTAISTVEDDAAARSLGFRIDPYWRRHLAGPSAPPFPAH